MNRPELESAWTWGAADEPADPPAPPDTTAATQRPRKPLPRDAVARLRAAGGAAWDRVENPADWLSGGDA